MIRIPALAAVVSCLTGCFIFNNPYDRTPTATLQIVVQGGDNAGTYIWNSADDAYEATVAGTPCSVYIDSSGTWRLTYGTGNIVASSTSSYAYCTLPPTIAAGWSSLVLSSVDDSEGGISIQGSSPDNHITMQAQILQVAFEISNLGNSATYQWQKSQHQWFDSPVPIGNGSTYTIQSGEYGNWFRVIITPTDSTGRVQGTPVASQPVGWP